MFLCHHHHNHLDERLSAMEAMLVMMLDTALKPPAPSLSARATLILSCSSPSPCKFKVHYFSILVQDQNKLSTNFGFTHPWPGWGIPALQAHVDIVQTPSQEKVGSLSPNLVVSTIVWFHCFWAWFWGSVAPTWTSSSLSLAPFLPENTINPPTWK